jgi:hypothetical protein
VNHAKEHDLVIMGLGKPDPHRPAFGSVVISLAEETETALIFISRN